MYIKGRNTLVIFRFLLYCWERYLLTIFQAHDVNKRETMYYFVHEMKGIHILPQNIFVENNIILAFGVWEIMS